jgi:hypothetical protein
MTIILVFSFEHGADGTQFFVRFFKFAVSIRGRDNATTSLQTNCLALLEAATDSDAEIQVTVRFNVTHGASIEATLYFFEA